MKKEILCGSTMLRGRKCDYSARYFYLNAGYICSKSTDKIVDISMSCLTLAQIPYKA